MQSKITNEHLEFLLNTLNHHIKNDPPETVEELQLFLARAIVKQLILEQQTSSTTEAALDEEFEAHWLESQKY